MGTPGRARSKRQWRHARPWYGPEIYSSLVLLVLLANQASGDVQFVLDNGMIIRGKIGPRLTSIAENSLAAGEIKETVRPIATLGDGLRRTYVATRHIEQFPDDGISPEVIKIEQPITLRGDRITGIRDITNATPFDEHGRRVVELASPNGPDYVVQGVTEISPVYVRLQGLRGKYSAVWDMRIATSSLPREVLMGILQKQHKPDSPDGYLATARVLLASHRFDDARVVLEAAMAQFPALQEEQKGIRQTLQDQAAQQLLQEIDLRRKSGRMVQARSMLERFPATEGVTGEVLVQLREMQSQDQRQQQQISEIRKQIVELVGQAQDAELKPVLEAFQREVERDLSPNTLTRFADFLNLAQGTGLEPTQKLALALAGWLMGSGGDTTTLTRIASLWEARDLCGKYLRSRGPDEAGQRQEWLKRIMELEGTSPQNIARLLETMPPPGVMPETQESVPGLYHLQVEDPSGLGTFKYYIQLPPEYDPHRRYPAIVTLHRAGASPLHQLQWWCGPYNDGLQERLGQATRHGYIVIAPEWTYPEQLNYEYSAREHAAVIDSLRDAFNRFAIDTDRVFLSGHSSGGDAAWDISVAHPDLWAGVIPIVASCEYPTPGAPKYVGTYIPNAKLLPMYFVCGELDGDLTIRNARVWDRYMKSSYNVLVTEYMGRGHEMFGDEIQRIFSWMAVCRRDPFPKKFEVTALRPWDNFFWCVEVDGYVEKAIVYPLEWDKLKVEAKATTQVNFHTDTTVSVNSAAKQVTLYLCPELVDFQQPLHVTIDGRRSHAEIQPSIETILEDVRTRGDRQHPYWAKVTN